MTFTIRVIDSVNNSEELFLADTVKAYKDGHTNPIVPPDGGLLYTLHGKEELICDGVVYVMNDQGQTVAKYRF